MRRDSATYRNLRQARCIIFNTARRLTNVHPTAYIHRTASVEKDLVARPYAFVGPRCQLTSAVWIDEFSLIAHDAAVLGNDHVFDVPGQPIIFAGRPPARKTYIGIDVWVGARAVILAGVSVGHGAIIGAGSVVTHDIPEFEIWAGAPARRVRTRFVGADEGRVHLAQLRRGQARTENFAMPKVDSA